jgi:DHA3 family macrolide efflux protein-like MFS transporter
VLIGGILLGLLLGMLAGGSLSNLAAIRLRWLGLLLAAIALRFATDWLLNAGVDIVDALRLPLLATAFSMLLVGLWANRAYPGISLAFVGVLSNAAVIVINGGFMPIYQPSLIAAGFTPADVSSAIHVLLPGGLDAAFLLRLGPLGDVIPIPLPIIQNVISIGDIFLAAGLAFFLFASTVRTPQELADETADALRRRAARIAAGTAGVAGGETGYSVALADTAALERPVILGGTRPGTASPSLESIVGSGEGGTVPVRPAVGVGDRIREHPYVRLALNGSFSALWTGQLISLFGDRVHQLALGAMVFVVTGSPVAFAFAFLAAALPNLFLSPFAGTFVDRWDKKEVLVVSDILRAAVILLIPVAAVTNILLVYPMSFAVTAISVFFRPARVAILPRLVEDDELITANAALWLGETIADVVGYALAGLLVAALASALPLAFWIDSATYLASAILLGTVIVRPAERTATSEDDETTEGGFFAEMRAGWDFLRHESVLLANTLQATVAQFTLGILIALTGIYAVQVFGREPVGSVAVWGFIETSIGFGNLIGGFVIGLIGARLAKGRMVIVGYATWGLMVFVFAITDHLALALGMSFGQGVANMVFVIPSQTLFQQRTPAALMGRVVGFRFSLVFGSMAIAMGVGGLLTVVLPVTTIIATFGLLTMFAGLAGLLVPAVRDA